MGCGCSAHLVDKRRSLFNLIVLHSRGMVAICAMYTLDFLRSSAAATGQSAAVQQTGGPVLQSPPDRNRWGAFGPESSMLTMYRFERCCKSYLMTPETTYTRRAEGSSSLFP